MVNELEFNQLIAARCPNVGAPLEAAQFDRCVATGAMSLIAESLKIRSTLHTNRLSTRTRSSPRCCALPPDERLGERRQSRKGSTLAAVETKIDPALAQLRKHRSHEA
jgi:hypothetical protein